MPTLKPWEIKLMQFIEPFQFALLGGSQMAYLRAKAAKWHDIAHTTERITFTVRRISQEGSKP